MHAIWARARELRACLLCCSVNAMSVPSFRMKVSTPCARRLLNVVKAAEERRERSEGWLVMKMERCKWWEGWEGGGGGGTVRVGAALRRVAAVKKIGDGLLQARLVVIRQKIRVGCKPRFEAG